ncbi:MAG: fumarate hydratase subunit alpha [Epulopiscium sp.]|nr:fumarate hydratase subunit alpha [Candidatus Epulonipiscium sp.]
MSILKEIHTSKIQDAVARLCMESNYYLSEDIKEGLISSKAKEISPLGQSILDDIIENAEVAQKRAIPICQDTGTAVVFVEIGQDVHVVGDSLEEAIQNGIRKGYQEGFLRKSMVEDPLLRVNTKDNTPAIIHYSIVKGEHIKITLAPKGGGSENMSALKMLKPSDGMEGVEEFVLKTVDEAGSNACPPLVVGVGIGGNFEMAPLLAKKALLRPINQSNPKKHIKEMEDRLLMKINALGIGPQGLGGRTTALGVNIEVFPTHIASLPVAVNIGCHVTRHKTVIL